MSFGETLYCAARAEHVVLVVTETFVPMAWHCGLRGVGPVTPNVEVPTGVIGAEGTPETAYVLYDLKGARSGD
jgi:hypothetical protein